MTDEEIEAENAEQGGDAEWCPYCRQYVQPDEYDDHERYHQGLP